jgi:hypothetical protein
MTDISKPGLIEYKCRRCGKIDTSIHVPSVLQVLISVMNDYELPKKWFGVPVTKTNIHHCENGGAGVSDLIGGTIDND